MCFKFFPNITITYRYVNIRFSRSNNLDVLYLGHNQMTNIGAFALAKSKLIILDVNYNHIGPSGFQALKESKIHTLYVEGNDGDSI
jgi:hypothetical protein